MPRGIHRRLWLVFLLLGLAGIFWLSFELFDYLKDRKKVVQDADSMAKLETQRRAKKIEEQLHRVEEIVNNLASVSRANDLTSAGLREKLRTSLRESSLISCLGVFYEPASGGSGRIGLMAERRDESLTLKELSPSEWPGRSEWYRQALGGRTFWQDPHLEKKYDELVVSFSAPFYGAGPGKKPAGVIRAVLPVSALSDLAVSLDLGEEGYGFILARNGTFVYHPIQEVVASQKSIFELSPSKTRDEEKALALTRKALHGESGIVHFKNNETGQTLRLVYQPIPSTRWTLGTFSLEEELFSVEESFRRQKIRMSLASLWLLTCLIFLLTRSYELRRRSLWGTAVTFSLLCVAVTCFILDISLKAPFQRQPQDLMMVERASLRKFVAATSRASRLLHGQSPFFIPTGVQLRTIDFKSANDIKITGTLWQKYREGLHDGIERGVFFPEAESTKSTEIFRNRDGGTELIGWDFEVDIREYFDYAKYPFDRPDIWLWMEPRDFGKEVVLTPDLDAYKITAPSALPGIQEGLILPGYTLLGSFYDYRYRVSNTDFGLRVNARSNQIPELYFHLMTRRNILTPFVSYIFPLILILSLLFIILLKFSQDEQKKTAYGLSGLAVIGVIVSVLFPTFLAHVSLRQELNVEGVTFLENFHFVVYFLLLLVSLNAHLFTGHRHLQWIQFEDGLLPKIIYWPLVTSCILILTLVHFY